jgi:hypothetical protein
MKRVVLRNGGCCLQESRSDVSMRVRIKSIEKENRVLLLPVVLVDSKENLIQSVLRDEEPRRFDGVDGSGEESIQVDIACVTLKAFQ